jgi:hypothetical protein
MLIMDILQIQRLVKKSAERVRVLNLVEKSQLERAKQLINTEKRITIKNWAKEQKSFDFYLNRLENQIKKIRSYLTKEEIENFTNQQTDTDCTKRLVLPKIKNRYNEIEETLHEEEIRQKYMDIRKNLRNIRHKSKEYIEDVIYLDQCYENLLQCMNRLKDHKDRSFSSHSSTNQNNFFLVNKKNSLAINKKS